jgi:hypothetical protein
MLLLKACKNESPFLRKGLSFLSRLNIPLTAGKISVTRHQYDGCRRNLLMPAVPQHLMKKPIRP